MTAAPRTDIAIAGAGIVGLAAAAGFAAASDGALSILVADPKLAGPAETDPRALALTPGSRHLLEALGVWDSIAPQAEPMLSIALSDSRPGDVLRPLLLGFPEQSLSGEPFAHIVSAQVIVDSLRARCVELGVRLVPGAIDREDSAGGAATFTLAGERRGATLLVAADGWGSPLREKAGIKSIRWSYGQLGLVAVVQMPQPHHGQARQFFFPAGPFALLPLPDDRAAVVWSEKLPEATAIAALDDDAFMEELRRRSGPELGDIRLVGPRGAFPLRGMIARRFVSDRLALIGDAARVMHPIAGQGVNLGLRDAAALVEAVVNAARLGLDFGGPDILAAYERSRRFDSALMLGATDALNRLFGVDAGGLRTIRDAGMWLIDRLPTAKQAIVRIAAGMAADAPKLLRGELP